MSDISKTSAQTAGALRTVMKHFTGSQLSDTDAEPTAFGVNQVLGTNASGQIVATNATYSVGGSSMAIAGGGKTLTIDETTSLSGKSNTTHTHTLDELTDVDGWSDTNPLMDSTAAQGTSDKVSRQDHVHPSDTTKADLAGATFTGVVTLSGSESGTGQEAASRSYAAGLFRNSTVIVELSTSALVADFNEFYVLDSGTTGVTLPEATSGDDGKTIEFINLTGGDLNIVTSGVVDQFSDASSTFELTSGSWLKLVLYWNATHEFGLWCICQ